MKRSLLLLTMFLALFTLATQTAVFAAAEDAAEPVTLSVEIDHNGNDLPLIDAEDPVTIDLFAESDAEYVTPIAENVITYVFPAPGTYRIMYNFSDGSNVKGTLQVTDTTAPEITLNNVYDTLLQTGDVLEIIDATVSDNSGENNIPYAVAVFFGEEDITSQFKENKLTLVRAGDYKFQYTATDSSGNAGLFETTVTVAEGDGSVSEPQSGGCNGGIAVEVSCIFAAMSLFTAAAVMRVKK